MKEKTFEGKVVMEPFAVGSKSERKAVQLETPEGKLMLRQKGAHPFKNPELEALVGKKVQIRGKTKGYTLFFSKYKVPEVEESEATELEAPEEEVPSPKKAVAKKTAPKKTSRKKALAKRTTSRASAEVAMESAAEADSPGEEEDQAAVADEVAEDEEE